MRSAGPKARSPESFDKELVRLAYAALDYRGDGPAPTLPPALLSELGSRYIAVYERLSGKKIIPGRLSRRPSPRRQSQEGRHPQMKKPLAVILMGSSGDAPHCAKIEKALHDLGVGDGNAGRLRPQNACPCRLPPRGIRGRQPTQGLHYGSRTLQCPLRLRRRGRKGARHSLSSTLGGFGRRRSLFLHPHAGRHSPPPTCRIPPMRPS